MGGQLTWKSKLRRSTTARFTAAAFIAIVGCATCSSRRRTGTWMALATACRAGGAA